MTEQQTPVLEKAAAPVQTMTPPPPTPKKKKKKKKAVKTVIGIVIALVLLAAIAFALYYFVFRKVPEDMGEIMTQEVMRSSIQSVVEGSGQTKAKNSAAVTPTAGGTVLELFVKEGDQVVEGDPLYRMDDTTARQAVTDAQKVADNCQKELQGIFDKALDLTISAPHAGKLMDIATFKVGDDVAEGAKIATLVNDTKLRIHLYYNYIYEGKISKGQSAEISVPAVMQPFQGTVETINMVSRVVPEGGKCFEVIFVMDNPGTLTEGMDASAIITASDGSAIYPYENSKLEYFESTEIKAKASGPVEAVHLLNYADIKAGQLLVKLGAKNNDEEIAAKENALKAATDKLIEAQKDMQNFNAVAPITGTVLSCNLTEGQKVEANQGITIADTSEMTVEIQVDERNVHYVTSGMMVTIDQYGTQYMGIVESVSQNANAQNGVATYPAVVKVDNMDGLLMSGMYVQYNFVASQSDNCLVVPVSSVQYVNLETDKATLPNVEQGEVDAGTDAVAPATDGAVSADGMSGTGGEATAKPLMAVSVMGGGSMSMGGDSGEEKAEGTIVFLKADAAPENAIEADPAWGCPKGFYPVVVEVGLADSVNVEILSGLNEGDVVFVNYLKQQADSYGG